MVRIRRFRTARYDALATAWSIVVAVVVVGSLWTGATLDQGAIRLDASGRTTVQALYAGDLSAVCSSRPDSPGRDRWAASGMCPQMMGSTNGLQKVEYEYRVGLQGTTALDDWIPAIKAVQTLSILVGAFAAMRLLVPSFRRRTARRSSAWSLRWLAACTAVGWILVPASVQRLQSAMIDDFVGSAATRALVEPTATGPGTGPFFVVALLLLIAEVWRRRNAAPYAGAAAATR